MNSFLWLKASNHLKIVLKYQFLIIPKIELFDHLPVCPPVIVIEIHLWVLISLFIDKLTILMVPGQLCQDLQQ